MSFKDIDKKIKSTYKSGIDNLVYDFYNPVLSESVKYDRITGFFNSSSLAIAAKGLIKFIDNEGHIRLLCGSTLSKEDLNSILNSKNLKNLINEKFITDIDNIEDQFIKDHVKILGWMVSNNLLEIKIGIKIHNSVRYGGMLHSKIGIIYDEIGDYILFNGSVNETANGWTNNIESLKVFKSWEDMKFILDDRDYFEKCWNNKEPSLEVLNIPEASKNKLIEIAPKNKNELNKLIFMLEKRNTSKKLFEHQVNAIDSWLENNKKGIFEMATGTGKTFTALKSLEKVLEEESILTVIACPYAHIAEQWIKELNSMNLGRIYSFYSSNDNNWRIKFDKLKLKINLGLQLKPIIVTTHNTFSMDDFRKKVNECNIKTFLIVDEMHHVGSSSFKLGLLPKYDYRLGLSATPSRYMDEEGTEEIINYFDKIVFQFNLTQALNKTNPSTNQTFLTPYEYYPIKVDLTIEEYREYVELTKRIAKVAHIEENDASKENLKNLIIKRKKIIDNASKKYQILRETLNQLDHKDHLIVYCSPQQIKKVLEILKEEGFTRHKFTQEENPRPTKSNNNLSEREMIINSFDNGNYQVLVAIKCLDEGVDIPSADQVIIMSSSTNPIEYVQRRGRVLRRYPNKEKSVIYDFSVIPNYDDSFTLKIIQNESKRLFDFINNSINKNENYDLLERWGVY